MVAPELVPRSSKEHVGSMKLDGLEEEIDLWGGKNWGENEIFLHDPQRKDEILETGGDGCARTGTSQFERACGEYGI